MFPRLILTLAFAVAALQAQVIVTSSTEPVTPQQAGRTPPPPTKPEDLGSIEGRVTDSVTGEPIRKSKIYLDGRGPNMPSGGYTAVTDDNGKYEAKGLEPGQYHVFASRSGFLNASYPEERTKTMTLAPGQNATRIDFKLLQYGVITGRLINHDDEPMPGFQITPLVFKYVGGKRVFVEAMGSPETTDTGEYRLYGLPPGRYYILFSRESYRGASETELDRSAKPRGEDYVATYYPGTLDPLGALPVDVAAGQTVRGIDVKLSKTRTSRIGGHVLNQTGAALRHAAVVARAAGIGEIWPVARGEVGPHGEFELQGIAPGNYVLDTEVLVQPSRWYRAHQELATGLQPILNLNINVTGNYEIAGEVKVDADTRPELRSFKVGLRLPGRPTYGYEVAPVALDDKGNFHLHEVNPARYILDPRNLPDGYYIKAAQLGDVDVLEHGVDLTRGTAALQIVLSAKPAAVSGSVKDDNSATVAGATVALVPRKAERQSEPLFYRSAQTDASGNFTLRNVPPGEYDLYSWTRVETDAWTDREFLRPLANNAKAVTLQEGSSATVELRAIPGEK